MDVQLGILLVLTFIIHLIGTLAYAFRIAGVRSGHIAIAFSLFNIMVLISRTSNAFQEPLLAKRVENTISGSAQHNLQLDLMLILLAASVATIAGGLLIPTVQRIATGAVLRFKKRRSMMSLLSALATRRGISAVAGSVSLPTYQSIAISRSGTSFPIGAIAMNFIATALWSVGVLASIYAGVLEPNFRVTASSLSAVINGVATIFMFVVLDPYLAGLTDDVVSGERDESYFRRIIAWLVIGRFAGTVFAQALLYPAAYLIAAIAVRL